MGNALQKSSAINEDLIKSGVEVTFIMGDRKFRTTITHGGEFNGQLQKHSEKLMRPYRRSNMTFDKLPQDVQKKILAELYAEHVILGWNAEDFEQEFSKEAARETLLNSDEYRIFIINESQDREKFRLNALTEQAGN